MTETATLKNASQTNPKSLIKWFWKNFVKPYAIYLLIAIFFMTVEGSMMGLLSYSVKALFDNVFLSGTTDYIWLVALAIFGIFSTRALSGFIQRLLVSYSGQKINKSLQLNLSKHLLTLDSNYFYKNPPGLLLERVRVDTQKIIEMSSNIIMTFGRDGISLISLVTVAVIIDWRWAFISFIGAPLLIIPILFLQNWIRQTASESRAAEAESSVRLDEIFHGINAIKLNAIEKYESNRLNQILEFNRKLKVRMEGGLAGMPAMIDIVAAFGFLGVMVYGGREIISGDKSVGEFMSFFTAMALIFEPLRRLSNISGWGQIALASMDKVYSIFSQRPSIGNSLNPTMDISEIVNFDIKFNDVSFFYDEVKVIENLNLHIDANKVTAIVGPSGSGKTTVFNLISRLIEPSEGNVSIGGININVIGLERLRGLLSVVSQESSLFDGSIKENIMIGRLDASDEHLTEAVYESYVHDFVQQFPMGLDTLVGPRGANLSGGQRQRILIARALLRNTQILLLDEPTSALDSKSESIVQQAIKKLSNGRTTIVIAHRISTIINADKIFVMKSGKVAQHGTHKELINQKGPYADMANLQISETKKNKK